MKNYNAIVIGGGASGLIAAAEIARDGFSVLLIEKMNKVGRKLRITGKGRCNLTNDSPLREFLKHVRINKKFIRPSLSAFFVDDVKDYFANLGINTVTQRGNRVFPESENAQDVVDALYQWCQGLGVKILFNNRVQEITLHNGEVSGVKYSRVTENESDSKEMYRARSKNVILCTGGSSYPTTGSSGDGFKIAQNIGYKINEIQPALIPLEIKGNSCKELQGLSLKNVTASLWCDNKKVTQEFGEMLFTHFGLSGPIILTLSRDAVSLFKSSHLLEVHLDLKPALDEQQLDKRILNEFEKNSKKKFKTILKHFLPSKMIPFCINELDIPADILLHQITAKQRKRFRNWLKNVRFEVSGLRPIAEAIVTAGGIEPKQVNPKTMESLVHKGLYFAGEVLDIDADTGGYNLQIAFSTGWIAGNSISKKLAIEYEEA